MAFGHKTGGRQKGTLNRRTREMLEAVEQSGAPLALPTRR